MATPASAADRPGHRRNKSSSVLRSIIAPKSHRRAPSDGTALDGRPPNSCSTMATPSLLPPDHPHNRPSQSAAGLQFVASNVSSPRKSQDTRKEAPPKSLHKKNKSSISLRSLGRQKEKPSGETDAMRNGTSGKDKPGNKKSSSNLASMFQKSRPSKNMKKGQFGPKDKENTTPPNTADPAQMHTPIWAQFSSQQFSEVTTTTKVPLNDRRSIEEEIALYTPADYSPSKQRNFFDYGQPSLQKRIDSKERPKSTILPSTTSATSFLDSLSRKMSSDRAPLSDTKGNESRKKSDPRSTSNGMTKSALRRASSSGQRETMTMLDEARAHKRGSRVMAAVAAFNGKSRESGPNVEGASLCKLDPQTVDAEFEAVLESRNIPQHQRAQMRTLKLEVKADFVRMHKLDTPQGSRVPSAQSTTSEKSGKWPTLKGSSKSKHESQRRTEAGTVNPNAADSTSKRTRPRSRTFTFGKADSPTKKQRADGTPTDLRHLKSTAIPKSPSSRSLKSLASNVSQKGSRSSKNLSPVTPPEFVQYLQKVQIPQEVEVGKLHKLRLLLRNETVEWVDRFISAGGMTELVGLLHRIMKVEWREEHEDSLLHEVLRALKGLCTTDLALRELCDIAPTLFPALLAMLFDEEHKGPSEFTTRELIINLLFTHLSSAPEDQLASRARTLLTYLKDPIKEKESSTIPFILEMHQPRPYQVWCKEITNVTKEVFWIFIHHLNVVPLPTPNPPAHPPRSYAEAHFPGPRAIVPAAPYVGGVEWDATNYIASHIDLVNGLLASLPTQAERNNLRSDFKASGFEKLMGHLRACNPKYYGAVHDSVKVWIKAAVEDGWEVRTVRMGAGDGKMPGSPTKSSPKKMEKPPVIEAPKVDLGLDIKFAVNPAKRDDDWF